MRHHSKWHRLPLVTLALSLLLVQTVSAATGRINAVDVRFRSTPSTASAATILKLLAKGTTVDILKTEGDWYQVSLQGTKGYVYKQYVTKTPTPAPTPSVAPAPVPATTPAPTPDAPAQPAVPATASVSLSTEVPAITPESPPVAPTPAAGSISAPPAADAAQESGTQAAPDAGVPAPVDPAGLDSEGKPLVPDPAAATTESAIDLEPRVVVEATALNIRQAATAESMLLGRLVFGQEVPSWGF